MNAMSALSAIAMVAGLICAALAYSRRDWPMALLWLSSAIVMGLQ